MRSTLYYVSFAVAVAVLLFAALIVQSLGLFDHHPRLAIPARSVVETSIPSPAAAETAPSPAANGELEKLRAENRQLQDRLAGVLNWILANFRGRYPLPEGYMPKLQLTALTDDYKLHPEAAEFLKITPDEEQKMNDAFAYAQKYLSDIEAAIVTVTNPRPDKVILYFPPFPEDGKQLKDDLYGALQTTLGQDRFDRFVEVSDSSMRSNFYQFGEASRTIVFELAYADDQQTPQLKVKDGWVLDLGPNSQQVTATETSVTNLPAKYSAYLPWLPDYVAAFSTK